MSWKPIDFSGLISLNEKIYDQLNQFLSLKEEEVCKKLIKLFSSESHPEIVPPVPSTFSFHIRLSDAVETIDKYVRKLSLSKKKNLLTDQAHLVAQSNKSLWGYVETIEETVIEFFQQIDQMGIDRVQTASTKTIDSIKAMLMHRMEQAIWAIKRLNKIIKEYGKLEKKTRLNWKSISDFLAGGPLDAQLVTNLKKGQEFLLNSYQQFSKDQTLYTHLWQQVQQNEQKYEQFLAFKILDKDSQELLKKMDQLLKIQDFKNLSRSSFQQEVIFNLRSSISIEKAKMLFKEYYQILLSLLFNFSYQIKVIPEDHWKDVSTHPLNIESLLCYKKETIYLEKLVAKYRQFLLTTDENPYVRSRLGFSEWTVGPEPSETKPFVPLIFELEKLQEWFQTMIDGWNHRPEKNISLSTIENKIQELIHEMSQPLISKLMLKKVGFEILRHLKSINEIASSDYGSIHLVGDSLSKALRLDWKYQVLYGLSEFQEIYQIHQGIIGVNEDRQHFSRFLKFKKIIQHLEQWLKDKSAQKHLYEIEQDINDIKENLQDFFMFVKRLAPSKLSPEDFELQIQTLRYQLLEYRYLFAGFFYHLRENIAEERFFRVHFLFVDQYFESIETQLRECVREQS